MDPKSIRHRLNVLDGMLARLQGMIPEAQAQGMVSLERRLITGCKLLRSRRQKLIRPRDPEADQMEFDREICAAGLKAFFRPLTPGEFPAELLKAGEKYLLVEEASRGVRLKRPMAIVWPGDVSRN